MSVIRRGSYVVSGECWATEVMWMFRMRNRVVGGVGARLMRLIMLVSFRVCAGIGVSCVKEEAVHSQDPFEFWEVDVLG